MQREARQEVSRVGRSRKGREKERKMSIGEKKKAKNRRGTLRKGRSKRKEKDDEE